MSETKIEDKVEEKKAPVVDAKVVEAKVDPPREAAPIAKVELPPVITKAAEYSRWHEYLSRKYIMLTPAAVVSGFAQQWGMMIATVKIDASPENGEVYQDRLFCKVGKTQDPLDDEVALTRVALRKLALAGGWNLSSDPLLTEQNYWMIRGKIAFRGLGGEVQMLSATEEYDLRDGSPQIRNFTGAQKDAARAHGFRGAEARAMNAACREYGLKQKYTRRELERPFCIMRMVFIPNPENEVQMQQITQQTLQGTSAMFPQRGAPIGEEINGMDEAPIDITPRQTVKPSAAPPKDDLPAVPEGYSLIRELKVEQRERKKPKTGTFSKWTCIDMYGVQTVTIKKELGEALERCFSKEDWKKGRPVQIVSEPNDYREQEIQEVQPWSQENQPGLPMA